MPGTYASTTPTQRPARKLLHPSAMQRTAKRFVGEVVELSRNCELGQEGDRTVVTSLAFPYITLNNEDPNAAPGWSKSAWRPASDYETATRKVQT